jgi:hypothetical protein
LRDTTRLFVGSPYSLVSQSVSRKDRFSGSATRVDVVVGRRDVLVPEQVADADEVAGTLGELGRKAVPEVVRAHLGGALWVETGGECSLS